MLFSFGIGEFVKLGINAGYINNGININQHRKTSININDRDKFRVVTSGRIEKQKNPRLFNEIASYFEDMEQVEFIWDR